MFRPTARRPARPGVVLIVVLAMLSLLAIVGLTVVYFAKDQAERARIVGDDTSFADDGNAAANAFLSSLVYGVASDGPGLLNAIRGYSLGETMYGTIQAGQPYPTEPFVGPGTFGENMTGLPAGVALDRRDFMNHRLFPGMTVVYDPMYSNPAGRAPGAAVAGTYVGKHAPYTYPDRKDYYLAAICPATGEVLLPSYHRSVFGSLNPPGQPGANPNWTNDAGKFLTARPRPHDHPRAGGGGSNFPYPPPNADGSITGDVQNLPGGFFRTDANSPAIARNDSIWIDIGLPPITLPGGRRVKPLVAALVLDLDGRLNLNVHGNRLNPATASRHASGPGMGPYEVNLARAFPAANAAEALALVDWRGPAQTRAGGPTGTSKRFDPHRATANRVPEYAAVGWTGFTAANPLQLPGFGGANLFRSDPIYAGGYDASNALFPNHPSLWNPGEWTGTATPPGNQRAFPMTDTKLLTQRYGPYPSVTATFSFAPGTAGTTLIGTAAGPTPNPPGQGTTNPNRTDVAHANRLLFGTASWGYDKPSLTPEATGNLPRHPAAGLAPVNLTRPLADYRDLSVAANAALPLSPTNVGNAAAANADRQQFAADIFGRLVVAAAVPAASATVNATTGAVTVVDPAAANVDTLRVYAQLAANIVDYLDSDDVSTRFEWYNPGAPEVVYGVEKPRLVVTEAYMEVVNDPADPALAVANMMPAMAATAHVRAFVELQNPTVPAHPMAADGPLGTGSVNLRYTVADGAAVAYSPYLLEIVRDGKAGAGTSVVGLLRNVAPFNGASAGNVTGTSGATADITFDFSKADGTPQQTVAPANGMSGAGIVVCAANVPASTAGAAAPDFNPMFAAGAINADPTPMPMAVPPSTTALAYAVPLADAFNADLRENVVLLRRLVNPYLAPDPMTNPYITVDTLAHVRLADRVLRKAMTPMNRMPRTAAMMDGYETNVAPAMGDPERPQSYGKVQPYAAFSVPVGPPPVPPEPAPNFPASMVLPQEPTVVSAGVRHTFGRQNSRDAAEPVAATFTAGPPAVLTDTLMAPFDWLVHLDRPPVNALELLHVSVGKPHELTTSFLRQDAVTPGVLVKHGHAVRSQFLASPLYRALDLLRVQPHGHLTAVGGRVPGRINMNTIQDRRVLRAKFDAPDLTAAPADPAYNGFDQAFVDDLWRAGGLMGTRTKVFEDRFDVAGTVHPTPIPGPTVHDTGNPNDDRPFLPFGTATVGPGGYLIPMGAGTARVFEAGVGVNDTLFRFRPPAPPAPPLPWLAVPTGAHPYQEAEAARKILNSTTTTSNVFAVWVTVGYFEVEGNPTPSGVAGVPDFVTLGREYYREAPGDARHKFFGVVDRSNLALKPVDPPPGGDAHPDGRPFFTTLEANVPAGTNTLTVATAAPGVVWHDGVAVTISDVAPNNQLVIGTGDSKEVVTVNGPPAAGATPGTTVITLTANVARPHYAGEGVSNVRPGNPGPQPNFDPGADKYKPVVPLWGKVQ